MSKEKMTLEENTVFADLILKPILIHIDMAIKCPYDSERLRLTLDSMKSRVGTLAALPFPETIDKAQSTTAMNEIYEKIIELIELRGKQMEMLISQAEETPGASILKQIGM